MYKGKLISGLVGMVDKALDELTYISYVHNRELSPEVSPERWAKIFPGAQAMEQRYQQSLDSKLDRAMEAAGEKPCR